MKKIENKLMIITSSPGTRDTLYIGYCTRIGDLIFVEKASMIVRYEEVGVPGLSSQPEKAIRLRPVETPGAEVVIPVSSISAMVSADIEKWKSHLGISRG